MPSVVIILCAVVLLFAVARCTRLITSDFIFARPRARLIKWLGVDSKLSYLLTCPWCMSMYVGAVAALATWAWHGSIWFWAVTAVLAVSHACGLLASLERD